MAGTSLTVFLGVLIAMTPLGTDSWQPILPALAADLGASVGSAQLTITTFFLGLALGQFGWGPVSDRLGRKPVLLAGMILSIASAAACAASSTAVEVAAGRFVLGLGMSTGPVIGRAIVRDLHSHERAAGLLARMIVVFSIFPIAAPLLGGALLVIAGWRGVLGLYIGIFALIVAALLRLRETAPEPRASVHPAAVLRTYGSIVREPRFVIPYGTQLCSQVGIFAFVTNSGFTLIKGLGVSAASFSMMFAGVMLGQIGGAWVSSRYVGRLSMRHMLRLGCRVVSVAGIAVAALAWAGVAHWSAVILPFSAYMFGTALIMPSATAAALTPFPKSAGAASSVMGATQFIVGAMVSTVLGLLYDGTARPLASAVALAGVGSLLIEKAYVRGNG